MKMWKKLLSSVFVGVLFFSLSVCDVSAASTQKQAYTYKVTVYAGNQGVFSGTDGLVISNENASVTQTDDKIVISGLNFGDEVSFTAQADVVLDASSKYYVQGIRLGGRDNDTVAAAAFLIRGDVDYVVAYGIKGNQVSYTVNYHDENGNEMLPSETFYGNVGDKPVVACKYVDGYAPQASGLTKTLKENAAENVLTFIYKPIPGPTVEDVVTTVNKQEVVDVVVNQTVVVGGTESGGPAGTGETDEPGTGGEPGNTGTGEVVEPGTAESPSIDTGEEDDSTESTSGGSENTETSEDVIIVDLDEEEVPLADADSQKVQQDTVLTKYLFLAGSAFVVLVILLASVIVIKKRGNKKEEK